MQRFASELFPDWKSDFVSLELLDGEKRTRQKARNYSWVIVGDSVKAATKAHRKQLLSICQEPSTFPNAICLRDGLGKTHELHRTPINYAWPMRVNLDGQIAIYDRQEFDSRLDLCRSLVQVFGKGSDTTKMVFTEHDSHVWGWRLGDELLNLWMRFRGDALTRLCWFLCENKGELTNDDRGPAD